MTPDGKHPRDLSPYLDNDRTDKEYNRIQVHLSECSRCRDELKSIREMEALFRVPEIQIEPSQFQWTRIVARLEASEPLKGDRSGWVPGWLGRWESFLGALAPLSAQRMVAGLVSIMLFGLMAVGGFQYLEYRQDQQILSEIADADLGIRGSYEQNGEESNPFRRYIEGERGNPFDDFLYPLRNRSLNPFVLQ